jgi:RHS repeat-associated protein
VLLFAFFALFLLRGLHLTAQPVNNYSKDVSMPAPNAAALGKFGDYSVGNFTGVPDISIPIYTVQEGPLSLPIGISYHASGIKVGEMASWVGTGWALNAGGIISRTVQGIKDEGVGGYYNNATHLETRINQANNTTPALAAAAANEQLNSDIISGLIDGEPDLFSFNVGGYSGKFYIDKNQKAQFIPKQDLILEVDGQFEGFTIVAPDGTRYTFGRDGTIYAQEKSLQEGQTGTAYFTSWYLLKVETSDRKYKINLSYDDEIYSYLGNASVKFTYITPSGGGYSYSSNSGDAYHKTRRTYMTGKRLAKIKGTTDSINFVATNVRTDLDDGGAKSLDKIEINSGSRCQKFDFVYTYFQDPASVSTLSSTGSIAKRLRLESLTQKSCDNTIVNPPYTFTYNGNFIAHRMSKAIDHWGFYNGATGNDAIIANVPPTSGANNYTFGTANRESNGTEMLKGVLADITFPTGGKTTFTFEANTVPTIAQVPPVQVLQLTNCTSPFDASCCGTGTNGQTTTISTYTPSTEDIATGKFTLDLVRPIGGTNGTSQCGTTYEPAIMIEVYIGSTFVTSLGTGFIAGQTTYALSPRPLSELGITSTTTTYTLKFYVTNGYGKFRITNQPFVSSNRVVGGLRVKEIKTTDGVSVANDILKQYDYSVATSPGSSSGKLLRFPTYSYSVAGQLNSAECILGGGQIITFNDESIVPLYSLEGNHIGYINVKETQSGNGLNTGNGTKLYKFSVDIPTYNGSYSTNAYPVPPLDPTVSNGQITRLDINSVSGTALKTTENTVYSETPSYSIGKIRKVIRHDFPGDPNALCVSAAIWMQFYTDYKIKTLPYRLVSVKETTDLVPTTTTYTYSTDATQPLFPLTTSMQNSDGKITVTSNKYITHSDYAADPVAIKMKALNMIANPIEVTSSVAGVQVNGARTAYSFFDVSTGVQTTSATNSFPYPYQFYKYKMTWNASGAPQVFGANSGWELEGTITKYAPLKAKPETINLRAWENATTTNATEIYTWETNGLIKTRQFKGFTWKYEYLPNTKLVSKITDKDGQSVSYTYDHLQRLKQAVARNGAVISDYTYTYRDAAQSNRSWIETKTTFNSVIGGTLSNNTTFKTVRQYLDGLGRPVQNVAVANSPNLKDVISVIEYDNQGREFRKYDPFESTLATGAFVATLPTNQPFARMEYEASPLSRIWKTTPPNWQPSFTEYGTNATNEVIDNTGNGYYAANTLSRVIKTDPDGRVQKIYTDFKGRKVFTVNVQNNVAGGYYMIYKFDDKDRMSKVYTPRGAWQEWWYTNDLDYTYLYDWNDNMTQKKLPDIAAVNMQYNARNQLVLMQDGKQSGLGQWLATQYDDYGRPSATGFMPNAFFYNSATTLNPTLSTTLTATTYSAVAGTELGKPIRTYNYFGTYLESFLQYDSYGRLNNTYSNNQLYSPSGAISATNFSEKIALVYDLADNVLTKTRTHKPNATTTRTILEKMDYDNGLRLKQMKHQIDALPEQILSYADYNIKNQLQTKRIGKVGALSYLQKVDYTYNSLGWLTGINNPQTAFPLTKALSACFYPVNYGASTTDLDYNDLFSMELKYEAPVAALAPSGTTVTPQYGGNISQVTWQVRGRDKQAYTLNYDAVNRMTQATYSDISSTGTVTGNRFDEKLTYDIRGNINTLQRWGLNSSCGWGLIDNLTYNYGASGYNIKNQLSSVTESSDATRGFKTISNGSAYSYDTNGNMTADPNKGITSIAYNHINLPTTITFTGGNAINFLYDAGGNKLRKTVSGTTAYVQDYVGGIEYRGGVLEAIYHAEGRVTTINSALKYEYALKDHLGNTRIMFSDKNGDGLVTQATNPEANEVTQENHYYPFGLNMEGVWSNTPSVVDNKYQFTGKELNDDFGLGLTDFGARMYDATIGRWNAFDPMSYLYRASSPYNYVSNNPINSFDPNGMYELSQTSSSTGVVTPDGVVGATGKAEKAPEPGQGNSVYIPNIAQRPIVLKMINDRASGQFSINEQGKLKLDKKNKDGKADLNHSDYYRDRLIEAIDGSNVIEIRIQQLVNVTTDNAGNHVIGKGTNSVDQLSGGGQTWTGTSGFLVIISGNSNYDPNILGVDGKALSATSGDILMHELVGHAIPRAVGADTGNAVDNENKARSQMGKRLRARDPFHSE